MSAPPGTEKAVLDLCANENILKLHITVMGTHHAGTRYARLSLRVYVDVTHGNKTAILFSCQVRQLTAYLVVVAPRTEPPPQTQHAATAVVPSAATKEVPNDEAQSFGVSARQKTVPRDGYSTCAFDSIQCDALRFTPVHIYS